MPWGVHIQKGVRIRHQMSSDVRYTLVYDIFSLFPGKIRHGGSG